ncbi:MAG: hypothetical protein Q9207_002100 [Kuettlingeria erythrocarpa]
MHQAYDHAFSAFTGDVIGKICCESKEDFLDHPDFAPQWFELLQTIINKEAQVLLGAGTASTARTLDFISYYILANDNFRVRLREELRDIMADYPYVTPSLVQLEQLPFLKALITEGLRYFCHPPTPPVLDRRSLTRSQPQLRGDAQASSLLAGLEYPLQRVDDSKRCKFHIYFVADDLLAYPYFQVPVGMSAYLMHSDHTVFPEPFAFDPDRWLGDVSPLMRRNLVPFSRGSRNCLGMK